MKTDVAGQVRNTRLPESRSLFPLFEAVLNSVQAIEESGRKDGRITIEIERSEQPSFLEEHGNYVPDVVGFKVVDNGIGFTDANFASFETLNSQRKLAKGGKGLGRMLWLRAFSHAEIASTYRENGTWRHRHFEFRCTPEGVHGTTPTTLDGKGRQNRTTVHLVGFKKPYSVTAPKRADAIGRRVVEHCLHYFVLNTMPRVIVTDPSLADVDDIDLTDLFHQEFRPTSTSRSFFVDGEEFELLDVLLTSPAEKDHRVHFAAHGRVVESKKLAPYLPHMDAPFRDGDGNAQVYWGCVTGAILDQTVGPERTSFELEAGDEQMSLSGLPSFPRIVDAAVQAISEYVGPKTEEAREASFERIHLFIETKAPKYRPLLEQKRAALSRLSGVLSDERLDLELHQMMDAWRREAKANVSASLQAAAAGKKDPKTYRDAIAKALEDISEVTKSDLAEYVMTRAAILRAFEELLAVSEEAGPNDEALLHSLFFPMRTTSNAVNPDEHNLWLLDERLSYHRYLASDLPFKKQTEAPVDVDSRDRPDILVYDHPVAFTQGRSLEGAITIVEFKKPERNNYSEENSPIQQVIDYVQQLRDGKVRRRDGSSMDTLDPNTPFYCYIVATMSPKLKAEAQGRGFLPTPDRQGYFWYNPGLNAYFEVSAYRKVLEDAVKRNRAFTDKLQIRL